MRESGFRAEETAREHGARSVMVRDAAGELLGFVEIDRVVAGRCCGGIRATAGVTSSELQRIAKVMTLKCGFVGLAAGGAKGGVVMPDGLTSEARAARFVEFGRAVGPLMRSGVWSHGADMGTTDRDIQRIRFGAGLGADPGPPDATRQPPRTATSSGSGAGLTVALSAEAVLDSLGIPLRGARIAVQGAGAVGRAAMAALASAGARIVGVSSLAGTLRDDEGLDVPKVLSGIARQGDAFTAGSASACAVLELDCDVLLTCAGTAAVDSAAAGRLRAGAVVCGANIPFAQGVEEMLSRRGIVIIPDFVAGGGGVLGATLAGVAGITSQELELVFRRNFKPLVARALVESASSGVPVAMVARQRALRVIEACGAAYGAARPETLLPERLAQEVPLAMGMFLSLERRVRGSTRLAALARHLHPLAVRRAEEVLGASLAVGSEAQQ